MSKKMTKQQIKNKNPLKCKINPKSRNSKPNRQQNQSLHNLIEDGTQLMLSEVINWLRLGLQILSILDLSTKADWVIDFFLKTHQKQLHVSLRLQCPKLQNRKQTKMGHERRAE